MYRIFVIDFDGRWIELDVEDLEFGLDLTIADLQNLAVRTGSRTKEIVFKGTDKNNNAFGYMYRLGRDSNLDLQNKLFFNYNSFRPVDCLIYKDTSLVFRGSLRLIEILRQRNVIYYSCVVTDAVIDFMKYIQERTLQDLDLTDLRHYYTIGNVIDSWDTRVQKWDGNAYYYEGYATGSNYVYPYIDYGSTQSTDNTVDFYNYRPALFVNEIFNRIFSQPALAGYTWEFKADEQTKKEFMSLIVPNNQEVMKSLPLTYGLTYSLTSGSHWFVKQNFSYVWTSGVGLFTVGTKYWLNQNTEVYDPANTTFFPFEKYDLPLNYAIRNVVTTIETDAIVKVDYTVNLQHNSATGNQLLRAEMLERDKTTTDYVYGWNSLATKGERFNSTLGTINGSFEFVVPKHTYNYNKQIAIAFEIVGSARGGFVSATASFRLPATTNSVISTARQGTEFTPVLPEQVKQYDFIKAIMLAFNLYAYTSKERPKHVIFQTYDQFYALFSPSLIKTTALDWSNKIIYSEDFKKIMNLTIPKSYVYTYKDDRDWINQDYKEKFNDVYSTLRFRDIYGVQDEKKVELIFGASPMVQTNNRYHTLIRYNDDNDVKPVSSQIRLLYYNGRRDCNDYFFRYDGFIGPVVIDFYGEGAEYYRSGASFSTSLQWTLPKQTYFPFIDYMSTLPNLYSTYHINQITELTDEDLFTLECRAVLTDVDISNFDFRTPIYISVGNSPGGNNYFKVIKISWKDDKSPATLLLQAVVHGESTNDVPTTTTTTTTSTTTTTTTEPTTTTTSTTTTTTTEASTTTTSTTSTTTTETTPGPPSTTTTTTSTTTTTTTEAPTTTTTTTTSTTTTTTTEAPTTTTTTTTSTTTTTTTEAPTTTTTTTTSTTTTTTTQAPTTTTTTTSTTTTTTTSAPPVVYAFMNRLDGDNKLDVVNVTSMTNSYINFTYSTSGNNDITIAKDSSFAIRHVQKSNTEVGIQYYSIPNMCLVNSYTYSFSAGYRPVGGNNRGSQPDLSPVSNKLVWHMHASRGSNTGYFSIFDISSWTQVQSFAVTEPYANRFTRDGSHLWLLSRYESDPDLAKQGFKLDKVRMSDYAIVQTYTYSNWVSTDGFDKTFTDLEINGDDSKLFFVSWGHINEYAQANSLRLLTINTSNGSIFASASIPNTSKNLAVGQVIRYSRFSDKVYLTTYDNSPSVTNGLNVYSGTNSNYLSYIQLSASSFRTNALELTPTENEIIAINNQFVYKISTTTDSIVASMSKPTIESISMTGRNFISTNTISPNCSTTTTTTSTTTTTTTQAPTTTTTTTTSTTTTTTTEPPTTTTTTTSTTTTTTTEPPTTTTTTTSTTTTTTTEPSTTSTTTTTTTCSCVQYINIEVTQSGIVNFNDCNSVQRNQSVANGPEQIGIGYCVDVNSFPVSGTTAIFTIDSYGPCCDNTTTTSTTTTTTTQASSTTTTTTTSGGSTTTTTTEAPTTTSTTTTTTTYVCREYLIQNFTLNQEGITYVDCCTGDFVTEYLDPNTQTVVCARYAPTNGNLVITQQDECPCTTTTTTTNT